jgi:hypothetical protein
VSIDSVIITQSNYIPWKGYFDNINSVDAIVLYDDVQFTRRDWRNRNRIQGAGEARWLTIPVNVKGKYHQTIRETTVSDLNWNLNHFSNLKHTYSKAPFWKENHDWLWDLYLNTPKDNLSEINRYFLLGISEKLGIKTAFLDSQEFSMDGDKTERLVNICRELGAKKYFSGPAAQAYMDEELFENHDISVHYFDYSGYPEYPQLGSKFRHDVTIFDLILNTGEKCRDYLKTFN